MATLVAYLGGQELLFDKFGNLDEKLKSGDPILTIDHGQDHAKDLPLLAIYGGQYIPTRLFSPGDRERYMVTILAQAAAYIKIFESSTAEGIKKSMGIMGSHEFQPVITFLHDSDFRVSTFDVHNPHTKVTYRADEVYIGRDAVVGKLREMMQRG
jgi:hypothetical protein